MVIFNSFLYVYQRVNQLQLTDLTAVEAFGEITAREAGERSQMSEWGMDLLKMMCFSQRKVKYLGNLYYIIYINIYIYNIYIYIYYTGKCFFIFWLFLMQIQVHCKEVLYWSPLSDITCTFGYRFT